VLGKKCDRSSSFSANDAPLWLQPVTFCSVNLLILNDCSYVQEACLEQFGGDTLPADILGCLSEFLGWFTKEYALVHGFLRCDERIFNSHRDWHIVPANQLIASRILSHDRSDERVEYNQDTYTENKVKHDVDALAFENTFCFDYFWIPQQEPSHHWPQDTRKITRYPNIEINTNATTKSIGWLERSSCTQGRQEIVGDYQSRSGSMMRQHAILARHPHSMFEMEGDSDSSD